VITSAPAGSNTNYGCTPLISLAVHGIAIHGVDSYEPVSCEPRPGHRLLMTITSLLPHPGLCTCIRQRQREEPLAHYVGVWMVTCGSCQGPGTGRECALANSRTDKAAKGACPA
jgi:hypothetical protein